MLDKLPLAAVLYDVTGRLAWANARAQQLLADDGGVRLPPLSAEALERVRAGGPPETDVREPVRASNGDTRWLRLDIVPISDAQPPGSWILATAIDITESERTRVRSEALTALTQNLARNLTNYQAALQTLARETAELIGDGVLVTMLSADGRWLQRAAHYHRDPNRRSAGRSLLADPYPATEGPAGQVIKTGRALRVDAFDVPSGVDDKYAHFSRQFGIRSFIIVPLLAEGRILGTLGVSRQVPPYTDEDADFLQALADSASVTILNARLHAEASQRFNRLASLHRGEMAAVGSLDLRLTLQVLVDQVRAGLAVETAAIFADDFATGDRVRLSATRLEAAAGFDREHRHQLEIPLVSKGQRLGTLELDSSTALALDAESYQFLETLAAQAASAIEIARLERAARSITPSAGGPGPAAKRLASLKPQQRVIVQLVAQGRSNREVAASVHLSENTVKFHLREIFRKLGLKNRVELARYSAAGRA